MVRRMLVGMVLVLGGCSTVPDWVPSALRSGTSESPQGEQFQFNWTLSGDRSVSPMQVFDNGRSTWLQFAAGQALPAVFRAQGSGRVPVAYTQQGPYVVLPGVWPELTFQGGHLQGKARRQPEPASSPVALSAGTTPALSGGERPASMGSDAAVDAHSGVQASVVPPLPGSVGAASTNQVSSAQTAQAYPLGTRAGTPMVLTAANPAISPPGQATASAHESIPQAQASPRALTRFAVSPDDVTLRSALGRWARLAGWTFQPEHWAVNADIPINGSASFPGGFAQAVESLVAATELSDRPLQPCFYANQVLRVVPYAQPCDRSVGTARAS